MNILLNIIIAILSFGLGFRFANRCTLELIKDGTLKYVDKENN